jgi:hypothetical protein
VDDFDVSNMFDPELTNVQNASIVEDFQPTESILGRVGVGGVVHCRLVPK